MKRKPYNRYDEDEKRADGCLSWLGDSCLGCLVEMGCSMIGCGVIVVALLLIAGLTTGILAMR